MVQLTLVKMISVASETAWHQEHQASCTLEAHNIPRLESACNLVIGDECCTNSGCGIGVRASETALVNQSESVSRPL